MAARIPRLEVRARKGDMGLATPPVKRFLTLFDGLVYIPEKGRADERPIAAVPASPTPGSPLIPTGNPLIDGVGPASYAPRVNIPETTDEGIDRIVPMRVSHEHFVANEDRDPRGMPVIAADGRIAGTVTDLWVDRSEGLVRYLEIALSERAHGSATVAASSSPRRRSTSSPSPQAATWWSRRSRPRRHSGSVSAAEFGRRVLMPIGFANVNAGRGRISTAAITAAQFGDVPRVANPVRVTLAEEDRVVGYFAGGAMYATPLRSEPLL